jgi:hypothetical protein
LKRLAPAFFLFPIAYRPTCPAEAELPAFSHFFPYRIDSTSHPARENRLLPFAFLAISPSKL